MTATDIQPSLWDATDTTNHRQRTRLARASCALCSAAPPATPLGLCRECLAAAAAENTCVTPPSDRRLAAIPFRALCSRCGSSRHPTPRCPA